MLLRNETIKRCYTFSHHLTRASVLTNKTWKNKKKSRPFTHMLLLICQTSVRYCWIIFSNGDLQVAIHIHAAIRLAKSSNQLGVAVACWGL